MPRSLLGRTFLETINVGADHPTAKVNRRQENGLSNIVGRKAGGSSRAFTSAIVLILLLLMGCFVWRILQGYV
jgi:hypothetical protein